jgi:hypothetical protein
VLLLGATKGLAHILLARLRNQLEAVPMGATLWQPNSDDPALDKARKRAEEALRESGENLAPSIVWKLPEGFSSPIPVQHTSVESPLVDSSGPRLWRPKPLAALDSNDPPTGKALAGELTIILPPKKKSKGRVN